MNKYFTITCHHEGQDYVMGYAWPATLQSRKGFKTLGREVGNMALGDNETLVAVMVFTSEDACSRTMDWWQGWNGKTQYELKVKETPWPNSCSTTANSKSQSRVPRRSRTSKTTSAPRGLPPSAS